MSYGGCGKCKIKRTLANRAQGADSQKAEDNKQIYRAKKWLQLAVRCTGVTMVWPQAINNKQTPLSNLTAVLYKALIC